MLRLRRRAYFLPTICNHCKQLIFGQRFKCEVKNSSKKYLGFESEFWENEYFLEQQYFQGVKSS